MQTAPAFDRFQFDVHHGMVNVDTKISWQDATSMQVFQHKLNSARKAPAPLWAVNDTIMRELLLVFMESRLSLQPKGTDTERRERIRLAAIARLPGLNATLDKLQLEYVQAKKDGTPASRITKLEEEIEGLDTQARITANGGMAFVAGAAYLYFRCGLSSVGVAEALGIKPPHARMITHRLNEVWKLRFNPDGTMKPVPYRTHYKFESANDAALYARMRARGAKWKEIAEAFGRDQGSICRTVRSAGLHVRTYKTKVYKKEKGRTCRPARAAKLDAGLCGNRNCKNPATPDYKSCQSCRDYFNKMNRALKKKKA
jgi:hypothetical protein